MYRSASDVETVVNSVTVLGCEVYRPGSIPGSVRGEIFRPRHRVHTGMGSTKLPTQWTPSSFSGGEKVKAWN